MTASPDPDDEWPESMRNFWFGEPWPSAELRAPVCEDDEYRIPVPVGEPCMMCEETIVEDDQGTSMGGMAADGSVKQMYGHRECMLRNVLGCSSNLITPGTHDHHYEEPGWYREDARRVQEFIANGRW